MNALVLIGRRFARGIFIVTGALLGGCISSAGIAPEATKIDISASAAPAGSFDAWPEDRWWEAYGEAELNRLVSAALDKHPDLTVAHARLAEAAAAIAYVSAKLEPGLNFNADSTYRRYPEDSLYPPSLGGDYDIDTRLAFDAVYELDLFGRNRSAIAAATSQAAAGAATEQAVRINVAAEVAQVYFELARLVAEREVVADTRMQREHILELVRVRVERGLDSKLELAQATGAISQVQGELELLDENIALLRSRLARLAVVDPATTAELKPALHTLEPPTLPAAIPSELLARRADIVAARWRVEAALAGTDSVRAEFYPSVNLAAFAGITAIGLSSLFESGSATFGLAPRFHLPIFDGGRLRAKLSFVTAEVDVAIADYNAALLGALQDVIYAVTSLRALDGRRAAQAEAERAAEEAYALAVQRYEFGLTGYLTVLATESDVFEQQRAGAALKARALLLNVALNRALGGGYEAEAVALN